MLEATAVLLTNPLQWRQRVVEQVVPVSADHYELRRSFQFEIPTELFGETAEGPIDALIPVCWYSKHALLELDVFSETGTPLHVLERRSIAGVLSQILDAWLIDVAGSRFSLSSSTLESACVASLDPWTTAQSRTKGCDERALQAYLQSLLSIDVAIEETESLLVEGRLLSARAYELLERDSWPADCDNTFLVAPLLAPYLAPRPTSVGELLETCRGHHTVVESLLRAASSEPEVLGWFATAVEAGVRWPLLTQMTVEPGKPFLIKTREIRDSGRPGDPRTFVHRADLYSARSYHLQVRSPGQSVWIQGEPTAITPSGDAMGAFNLFENSEQTNERFTTYTSLEPRPDSLEVTLRFKLHTIGVFGYWFAIILVVTALAAALSGTVDVEAAALLTIPTTIVSAFLLVQETPLTARFLRNRRVFLITGSLVLWVVAIYRAVFAVNG